MEPEIRILPPTKLIGMKLAMTFAEDKTPELWGQFIRRKNEIRSPLNTDLFSMQVYPPAMNFERFTPNVKFEKWAAVEVADFESIPHGMSPYDLGGGQYAVFIHHGRAADGARTFQYIFGTWLPASPYRLDGREHFELLPANYRPNDPNAREEVWIPITEK